MRSKDIPVATAISGHLQLLANDVPLPGIQHPDACRVLVEQLVDSVRRVTYVDVVGSRSIAQDRADPWSDVFDPIRGAILQERAGNIDEAFWLVFLAIHFGKHGNAGWRLCRDVYSRLAEGPVWTWDAVSTDPGAFSTWLSGSWRAFYADDIERKFGNHRKYETLRPDAARATHRVVESYVAWVGPTRSHPMVFQAAGEEVGADPRAIFHRVYERMNIVSFGRTAKFDYLTMIGKLGLATLEADSTYMREATGPKKGAKLLFFGSRDATVDIGELEDLVRRLDNALGLGSQSMQVLEDALCNWQKSPLTYQRFR